MHENYHSFHVPSIVNCDQQLLNIEQQKNYHQDYRMWCRVVHHNLVVTDACHNITGGGHVENSLLHPRSLCYRQLL